MEKEKRMANYELLRIVAMLMVVCLHYLTHADVLTVPGSSSDGVRVLGDILESLCIVSVNVYVLISGYFLSGSHFRIGRLFDLLCRILFYTLLIPAAVALLGIPLMGGQNIWKAWFYFLPVSMEHYWFVTAYFFMVLLSPFLNAGLSALTKHQLQILLLCLLFFTCFLPSLSPVRLTDDQAGYGTVWFLVLYLTGGYIRRYGLPVPAAPGKAAAGYFACAGGTWGLALLLQRVTETSGSLLYYSQVPFHYDFVLGYAGAICLFSLFGCLQVPEGRGAELVRRIAPLTFGVYLIHENIDIRDRWLPSLTKLYGPVPRSGWMLLHMAACVLTVFACCLFADWIRSVIFDRAGQLLAGTRFAARLRRMDGGK